MKLAEAWSCVLTGHRVKAVLEDRAGGAAPSGQPAAALMAADAVGGRSGGWPCRSCSGGAPGLQERGRLRQQGRVIGRPGRRRGERAGANPCPFREAFRGRMMVCCIFFRRSVYLVERRTEGG